MQLPTEKIIVGLVVVLAAALLFLSFFQTGTPGSGMSIDFSRVQKFEKLSDSSGGWVAYKVVPSIKKREMAYYRISPVDGVFFRPTEDGALSYHTWSTAGKSRIDIKSGIYVFYLNDVFNAYEINVDGLRIFPTSKWAFLVYATAEEVGLYSFNAVLSVDRMKGKEKLTNFMVFPSFVFRGKSDPDEALKDADMVRIASEETFQFVNVVRNPAEELKKAFASDDPDAWSIVRVALSEIRLQMRNFNEYQKKLAATPPPSDKDLQEFEVLTSDLMMNEQKKSFLVGKKLEFALTKLINSQTGWTASAANEVKDALATMKQYPGVFDSIGMPLLQKYYYPQYFFELQMFRDTPVVKSEMIHPMQTALASVLPPSRTQPVHETVSTLFFAYFFLDLPDEAFNRFIDTYLEALLKNNQISPKEFSTFALFLSGYLSQASADSPSTFHSLAYLFQITDSYFATIKNAKERYDAMAKSAFTYTQLFSRLKNNLLKKYFYRNQNGILLLKEQYYQAGLVTIADENIDGMKKVDAAARADVAKKDTEMTRLAKELGITRPSIYLSKFRVESGYFSDILRIMTTYEEYRKSKILDDEMRTTQGVVLNPETSALPISRDKITTYLSQFNGLDISTLRILNEWTLKTDGFYDVSVRILGIPFFFKIADKNHLVYDLRFVRDGVEDRTFEKLPIDFDQREARLRPPGFDPTTVTSPEQDFGNLFESVYLRKKGAEIAAVIDTSAGDRPDFRKMSPEAQIFVQREIIEKDFANLGDVFTITLANVYAEVKEWRYTLQLFGLESKFRSPTTTYYAKAESRYSFVDHAFFRFEITATAPPMDGVPERPPVHVNLLPARIPLTIFLQNIRNLGDYLEVIFAQYKDENSTYMVDFRNREAIIDGVRYPVSYSKPN